MTQAVDPLQAVISAGGLETARTRKVVIIHRAADGTITQRVADLRAYAHHGQGTGIVLQSQDIVFVPAPPSRKPICGWTSISTS
jgi:protein involved in polysaccharide export with SLBB domain